MWPIKTPEDAHDILEMCNGFADNELVKINGKKMFAQTWREFANDYLDRWEP